MFTVYSFVIETVILGANGGSGLSDTDELVEVEPEGGANEEGRQNGEATGNLASCSLNSSCMLYSHVDLHCIFKTSSNEFTLL